MKDFQNHIDSVNDPKAQQKLAKYYEANPSITATIKSAEILPWVRQIEDQLIKTQNADFLDSNWFGANKSKLMSDVNEILNRLCFETELVRDNKLYYSAIYPLSGPATKGIALYQSDTLDVSLLVVSKTELELEKKARKGVRGITILENTMHMFAVKGSGTMEKYCLEQPIDNDESVPDMFNGSKQKFQYQPGDLISIYGGYDGVTYKSCETNSLFLCVTPKVKSRIVRPQYDVDSGKLLACIASDSLAPRIQMVTILLREFDVPNSAEIIKPLLKHKNPYVRWHVARELFFTDKEKAKEVFEMLANDKSPVLREGAQECLKEIYGEETCLM